MSTHDFMRLTDAQVECLRAAGVDGIDPWAYGSTTISTLKTLGYIKARVEASGHRVYGITDEGKRALEQHR